MISVVIKDDGEPKVIQLTYQNLWKELKDIPDAELLVSSDWFKMLPKVKNKFVCFVEADCLVNSGYFASLLGLYKKNPMFRRIAMLSSGVGVNEWGNKFYGYSVEKVWSGEEKIKLKIPYVQPVREKKTKGVHAVQIGYLPGAIVNTSMLRDVVGNVKVQYRDLIRLSAEVSFAFWKLGDGHRVHVNPTTTYVTTCDYVNDLGEFDPKAQDVMALFKRESI